MSEQMSRLTIPDNIKVGFQKRSDTYSGKLAYVVFRDTKGVLRKSGSWERWRDKNIPAEDYDNTPVSGFVLNRDVGGVRHSYGEWNPRIEKVRVYDPRGFEFEIGIPNLLFILQECSSIKGKGLEGDFVYSWMGKDLILLPVSCKEYQESQEHNALVQKQVDKSEIKEGCLYRDKDHQVVMYLGRHQWWGDTQDWGKKLHVFRVMDSSDQDYYLYFKDFKKIAEVVSDSAQESFADSYESFVTKHEVGDKAEMLLGPITNQELIDINWWINVVQEINGVLIRGRLQALRGYYGYSPRNSQFGFQPIAEIRIKKDGTYTEIPTKASYNEFSFERALQAFKNLSVKTVNGRIYKLEKE